VGSEKDCAGFRLVDHHFVSCERREHVIEMNVLMNVMVDVRVVNGLEQAARDSVYPDRTVERLH
jgi:hypothetical protein